MSEKDLKDTIPTPEEPELETPEVEAADQQPQRRPLIWRRKSAAMYGVIQTAGAKRLPSQACSIVPIAAARCMSTAPTMASGFLNIPVPIIPKFRVGHYALHNTVSMRVPF